MPINKDYITKLIKLAREINELDNQINLIVSKEISTQERIKFSAKLSYLLGYIEALAESENANK